METLGATTVVLTDKTDTLTENRMAVRRLWVESGEIETAARKAIAGDALLQQLLQIAVLCNDASLGHGGAAPSGDPMEVALLQAGRAAGLERHELLRYFPITIKHAFDHENKMMATVHKCAPASSLRAARQQWTMPRAGCGASGLPSSDSMAYACSPAPANRKHWRMFGHFAT